MFDGKLENSELKGCTKLEKIEYIKEIPAPGILIFGTLYVLFLCMGWIKVTDFVLFMISFVIIIMIDRRSTLRRGTKKIKKYIQKKQLDSKLFTIDLLCHGTAKNQVWKDYIAWLEKNNKAKLMRFCFRYKPEGWKAYPGYAEFDSHKKLINTPETSVFSKLHLSAYSIEKGCFQCPFASEERNGDITLGDYWGIEYIDTTIRNYKDGVSLILCNSEVARILILRIGEKCRENHDFLIETKSREFIKYQDNFQRPTEMPKQYEEFWKDYEKKGFEDILIKYIGWGRKYKVLYNIKKIARKTMIIELYRRLKRGN